jgi:hypothetical protein
MTAPSETALVTRYEDYAALGEEGRMVQRLLGLGIALEAGRAERVVDPGATGLVAGRAEKPARPVKSARVPARRKTLG